MDSFLKLTLANRMPINLAVFVMVLPEANISLSGRRWADTPGTSPKRADPGEMQIQLRTAIRLLNGILEPFVWTPARSPRSPEVEEP